jgi:hypothetical protein
VTYDGCVSERLLDHNAVFSIDEKSLIERLKPHEKSHKNGFKVGIEEMI